MSTQQEIVPLPNADVLGFDSDPDLQLDLFAPGELARLVDNATTGFTVLDAIFEESVAQRLPRVFQKSNTAVHVQTIEGNYSLVMRMLMNVLLALSSKILKTLPEGTLEDSIEKQQVIRFEASATDIKNMMGWGKSNDYQHIYDALDALMTLIVRWSVKLGDEQWTQNTTMLSIWGRTETGKVSWSWMPSLCKLLFGYTDGYTSLDMVLLRKFRSKYTLAIFENCIRYKNCSNTTTLPTRHWVSIIAGPSKYKDYREFKRTALNPSIDEINKTPGCPITVQLEEIRGKRYNRVEKLRFKIYNHKQNALFADLPMGFPPGLLDELKALGISSVKLVELANAHTAMYLAERVRFVKAEIARRGNIANPAGFYIKAVEDRFNVEYAQAEAYTLKILEERESQAPVEIVDGSGPALDRFDALQVSAPAKHAALIQEFLTVAKYAPKRSYEKRGPSSHAFRVALGQWLVAQEAKTQAEEPTS